MVGAYPCIYVSAGCITDQIRSMPVHHFPGIEGVLYLGHHLGVAVQHSGVIHHLGETVEIITSDEFPDILKTETDVIKRAYRAAQDPDGYEGMTFARWLSDVVAQEWHIDWAAYM